MIIASSSLYCSFFALISACAQQPTQPVELDAESECPTRLQVGQVLTLTLPSNPSTGYRWRVENPAANVLRSLGPEVYSAPEEEDLVGNAGVSTWRYQASGTGDGQCEPHCLDDEPIPTQRVGDPLRQC